MAMIHFQHLKIKHNTKSFFFLYTIYIFYIANLYQIDIIHGSSFCEKVSIGKIQMKFYQKRGRINLLEKMEDAKRVVNQRTGNTMVKGQRTNNDP